MARKSHPPQRHPTPHRPQAGPAAPPQPDAQAMDRLARQVERALEAERPAGAAQPGRLRQVNAELQRARGALEQEQSRLDGQGPALARELPGQRDTQSAGLLERLRRGVAKTRDSLTAGLSRLVPGVTAPPALLEGLEEVLLAADVGPVTTTRLLAALRERLRRRELDDPAHLKAAVQEEVLRVLQRPYPPPLLDQALARRTGSGTEPPAVLLLVGVNGTGKTTTLGKLAALYTALGRKVLLVAGDTFRAAAAAQLARWAERSGSALFAKPPGTEPSAVIFQALQQALAQGVDLVLCDTAGRLHTKVNLMEELKKVKRVIGKVVPQAPQDTWLVLDANTGQNAIHQTRQFHEALGLSGLVVTKLDGTARGGVIIGISNEFDIPVRYLGVGEAVEDLRPFEPAAFVQSLFD